MNSEGKKQSSSGSEVSKGDIENLLEKIGMTEYKAKIYSSLVENGICDAKTLSKLSDVPVTRVYESLKEMKEDGLIAVEKKRPKKYKVVSLDSLKNIIERKRENLEREIREKERIFEKIKDLSPEPNNKEIENEKEGIWFIEEAESTIENFKKNVEEVEDEILIFSGDLSWVPELYDDVKGAIKRGIEIKLLCEENEETKPRMEKLRNIGVEIKGWSGQELRGAILDSREVSLVLKKPINPSDNEKFRYEIIKSKNPVFVETMKNYFEFWWSGGVVS